MAVTGQSRLVSNGNRIAAGLIVAGVVSLLTLGVAFGLLALGVEAFWVAFPVGFGGVLPIALGIVALRSPADG